MADDRALCTCTWQLCIYMTTLMVISKTSRIHNNQLTLFLCIESSVLLQANILQIVFFQLFILQNVAVVCFRYVRTTKQEPIRDPHRPPHPPTHQLWPSRSAATLHSLQRPRWGEHRRTVTPRAIWLVKLVRRKTIYILIYMYTPIPI